ncbi:hypothetical protein JCM15548_1792 [Geofilum rubicundum JCM 15548]|uniref:DUF4197 domain-containing protein n=2 Tax=Geofilum TaxID=1236988 RepID=A0A0E9LUW9_9BACT|nr:hypothetical protein JCM15548_1792 [Geofilum rubicundum JCM 15548]
MALLLSTLLFSSCDELFDEENGFLSNGTIVKGLKEMLVLGTHSASGQLSMADGYFADEAVKIMLPPEADIIVDNISLVPGGNLLIEQILLGINRSAEDAAREAAPIFINAITDMSIVDGLTILNGDNDAATTYLRNSTYTELFGLYQPKLQASLDKKLIGNVSTNSLWATLVGQFNSVANTLVGQMAGLQPVNTQLDGYLTDKALDGLFLKIAEEEIQIRTNPAARGTDLLNTVFGQ